MAKVNAVGLSVLNLDCDRPWALPFRTLDSAATSMEIGIGEEMYSPAYPAKVSAETLTNLGSAAPAWVLKLFRERPTLDERSYFRNHLVNC